MDILIVVDMQNDFIDGTLGTEEAVKIVPKVVKKIKEFDGIVLATRDTHSEEYLETQEGKKLPIKHCIKNSTGWEIRKEVSEVLNAKIIDKPTFGSLELAENLKELNSKEKIESITLIGLCTDICVISNAIIAKASLPEVPIIIDSNCCAGVTIESHTRALEAMKSCQIEII